MTLTIMPISIYEHIVKKVSSGLFKKMDHSIHADFEELNPTADYLTTQIDTLSKFAISYLSSKNALHFLLIIAHK